MCPCFDFVTVSLSASGGGPPSLHRGLPMPTKLLPSPPDQESMDRMQEELKEMLFGQEEEEEGEGRVTLIDTLASLNK